MLPDAVLMDTSNSPTHPGRAARNLKGKGKANVDATFNDAEQIPSPVLLLSLPALLTHPADHPNYVGSLQASLDAIKKAVNLHSTMGGPGSGTLSFEQEVLAYGMIAELGLKVVSAGVCDGSGPSWTSELDNDIEDAIVQGTRLSQQIASLRHYRASFSLMRAHLLLWKHQLKACRALLKREISQLTASDSSATVYTCYLTYITALLTSTTGQAPEHSIALSTLQKLLALAKKRGDAQIAILCLLIRLQILFKSDMWELVGETCSTLEAALGLTFAEEGVAPNSTSAPTSDSQGSIELDGASDSSLALSMKIHTLILGVIFHTRSSQAKLAGVRLTKLHDILDSDTLESSPDGSVSVTLASGPPLVLNVSHPRVIYELAFLASGVSKRDVVGRKPKRKVFVREGLGVSVEAEKLIPLPICSTTRDMQEIDERLQKIRADMLCDMVSVCIMRSEFDGAEKHLSDLIAHTRSTDIFTSFAPRITLLSAHLAHALNQCDRALACYRSAGFLDESGFVKLAARVGEVTLRHGLRDENDRAALRTLTKQVAKECHAFGAQFEPFGRIFDALLAEEIMEIKKSLKSALEIVTRSSDNHLRSLILALMANMYLLTASDHAQLMLKTCQQLAAGLGAPVDKADELANGGTVTGNLPLGVWTGEKFVELYRRDGKTSKVEKQEKLNAALHGAMDRLLSRPDTRAKSDSSDRHTESDEMEVDAFVRTLDNGMDFS